MPSPDVADKTSIYLAGGPLHGQTVDTLPTGDTIGVDYFGMTGARTAVYHRFHDQCFRYDGDIEQNENSYAASGEDVWILGQFANGYEGYAMEVGAYDGESTSNTLLLEHRGWKVICVEPLDGIQPKLRSMRKIAEQCACDAEACEDSILHVLEPQQGGYTSLRPTKDHPIWRPPPTASWSEQRVRVETIDRLLAKHQFPRLDALSIDTEGTDLDVLKGCTLGRWQPRVIITESWDEDTPVTDYLRPFGYLRVERRGVNNLYRYAS